MSVQVFMSHTRLDTGCCDAFDIAAARVGIKVFRSEFESLELPAWKTIRDAINKSSALFLLVGKELVKAQALSEADEEARANWKFTQNWISYEIGLACQRGIDVWVISDNVEINFPVPYLNNYALYGVQRDDKENLEFAKWVLRNYLNKRSFSVGVVPEKTFRCPYCGAFFNLHSILRENQTAPCPTCLNNLVFPTGWGPKNI